MLAHTMGNPFDLEEIRRFCDENHLWLIEDNCDALGSEYNFRGQWKKTGTVGHIGTSSFYPPHHMTMGEGGAVYTDDPLLHRIVNSLRDWGRDCWCPPEGTEPVTAGLTDSSENYQEDMITSMFTLIWVIT